MSSNMFDTLNTAKSLVLTDDRPDDAFNLIKEAVSDRPDPFTLNFIAEWIRHIAQDEESVRSKFDEIVMFLKDEFPDLEILIQAKPYFEPSIAKAPQSQPVEAEIPPAVVPIFSSHTQHKAHPKGLTHKVSTTPFVEGQAMEPVPKPVESPKSAPTPEEEPTPETVPPPVPVHTEPKRAADKLMPVTKTKRRPAKPTSKPTTIRGRNSHPHENLTLTFYPWQKAAIERAARKQNMDEADLLAEILQSGDATPLAWSRYKHGDTSPTERVTVPVVEKTKEVIEKGKHAEGMKTTTRYVRKMLFKDRAEKA